MYRVAVIGAGAAGLCVLRHLTAQPGVFEAVAFEQMDDVGGTWIYTENTGKDSKGRSVHSSMYKNLLTNLPKEIMSFPDFPFEKLHPDWPSFIDHQQVLQYLREYANEFKLLPHIQFNTSVERVHPLNCGDRLTAWEVTTRHIDTNARTTQKYDAVFVCNGHYSDPIIPVIEGQDSFTGELTHSHDYRHPEDYKDKTVVLLGAGPSGTDIAFDLAPFAKQVVLSHNKDRLRSEMRTNMLQKPGIKNLRGNLVTFLDDSELVVDALMCCTGYLYTFPFLTPESRISINGQRVYPLFKHLINAEYPRQFFVGICHTICPFPHFDVQIRFCLKTLDGGFRLPDTKALKEDIEADYLWRVNSLGWKHQYAHKLQNYQWEYLNDLAKLAGLSGIKPFVKSLYDEVHDQRQISLGHYKKCSYQLLDDVSFLQVDNTQ